MRNLLRRVTFGLLASSALCAGIAQTASAADLMPLKAPPIAAPVVLNWTGFYVGAHLGAGWGTVESNVAIAGVVLPVSSHNINGVLGGVQGGYNHQFGNIVLGIEASGAGSGISGTTPCIVILSCTTNNRWIATLTGRVGVTVAPNTLVYVKGGGAWANNDHSFNVLGLVASTVNNTAGGWVLGTGAEYKINDRWSAAIEYDYMDFGTSTVNFPIAGVGIPANINSAIHTVTARANYRVW